MGLHKIKKGLDLPIDGKPVREIHAAKPVRQVALIGPDYVGLKPDIAVAVGDRVKLGDLLFTDKKRPAIRYTSPGCGTVLSINRGEKRAFLSIIIQLEGDEERSFTAHDDAQIGQLSRKKIITQLLDSGVWPALRSRPFSKVADPEKVPHSIFVTAMDSRPLAPSLEKVLEGRDELFRTGLEIIGKLTEGKIFLCVSPDEKIPQPESDRITVEQFSGPHPAGNVGTHIHLLDPVYREKEVWHLGAQDIVAFGYLFREGKILTERIIALAGPSAKQPRLLRTRLGASLKDLAADELQSGEHRVISGSVLDGRLADETVGFLGRYHQQVSVMPEERERKLFGWLSPGARLYSVKNIVLSKFLPRRHYDFTTAIHGGLRALVPIGSYEKVMPLDILPTYLLRALAVDDVEDAEKLGCLELDEEDLALCTFVCPSKIDHGQNLRRVLTLIEKEG